MISHFLNGTILKMKNEQGKVLFELVSRLIRSDWISKSTSPSFQFDSRCAIVRRLATEIESKTFADHVITVVLNGNFQLTTNLI